LVGTRNIKIKVVRNINLPEGPPLRKCKNPSCDGYFYGWRNQQYCDVCSKIHAQKLRKRTSKEWYEKNKQKQNL